MIKFEKEYMVRGPLETKAYIIDDLVLVRLRKVLTQAEYQLAKTSGAGKGRDLIKQVRIELVVVEGVRISSERVIESSALITNKDKTNNLQTRDQSLKKFAGNIVKTNFDLVKKYKKHDDNSNFYLGRVGIESSPQLETIINCEQYAEFFRSNESVWRFTDCIF